MTDSALLQNINAQLGAILVALNSNSIPVDTTGIAGAGAEPAVEQQVNAAIAAAAHAEAPKRGRGRPAKTETAAPAASAPAATAAPTQAAPVAPATPEFDPFALGGPAAPAVNEKPRSLEETRAALLVYQAKNGQPAAVKLIKDVTGKETIAKLVDTDLPKLFKASLGGASEITLDDVKAVLVKAEERRPKGGAEVLEKNGAVVVDPETGKSKITITALKPEQFIKVISEAHAVQ
jgi:hypothetical protein